MCFVFRFCLVRDTYILYICVSLSIPAFYISVVLFIRTSPHISPTPFRFACPYSQALLLSFDFRGGYTFKCSDLLYSPPPLSPAPRWHLLTLAAPLFWDLSNKLRAPLVLAYSRRPRIVLGPSNKLRTLLFWRVASVGQPTFRWVVHLLGTFLPHVI